MTISNYRYEIAQNAEKAYWEKYRQEYCNNEGASNSYWQHHLDILKKYVNYGALMRILDIGCGPYGLVNYLPAGERYGLDPLMDYYLNNFNMPNGVHWLSGRGEDMPFENGFFDLLISTNAIDHTHDPEGVLREMNRVMKPGATLFLTVNTRPYWARFAAIFMEKIGEGDLPHPHSFHVDEVKKLLETSGFSVINTGKERGGLGDAAAGHRHKADIPLKPRNKIASIFKIVKGGNIKKLFSAFLGLVFLHVFNAGHRFPKDHSIFIAIKKYA